MQFKKFLFFEFTQLNFNTLATVLGNGKTVTVTAESKGNAIITASCGEQSATCSVTVTPKLPDGWNEEFKYKGEVESFTAPVTGLYKLEVWGAGGAGSGGTGGYSYGYKNLSEGDILYVCVGGANRF